MMEKLLEVFNEYKFKYNLAIDIGYTKVLDWFIEIKQGNHAQYKQLFWHQDCDLDVCIAKAYLFLTEWIYENNTEEFNTNTELRIIEEEETEEMSELRIAGITVEEMENKTELREALNETFYDILNKTNEIVLAVNRINKEREEK